MYLEKFVTRGDQCSIESGGSPLASVLSISVYASSDTSDSNNLLQSVSFDVSCSLAAPLNAPDRFGSLELISYLNENQGVVNTLVTGTYIYSINAIADNSVAVESLTSVLSSSEFDVFTSEDLSDQLDQVNLEFGDTVVLKQPFSIHLSMRQTYSSVVTVSGRLSSDFNATCQRTETFTFLVSGEIQ